ncbi:tripartite tricarboxylate transporter substrate binding protein [Halomonas daqingensis]|uniref:Tripartite tricarboxylate transporter substrate binding protein n=3 Tax=Billgrantia desiderata TaxID=52021 RepID=A0ABS9B9A5_9GAMM|nr:tripartite tricarboxylate transporter substrate binding protein [Halomonas desiderata]MCE8044092.1 tripartite tricarboxylate transporter substrate binding protein [Halomonas desiderata]MCE8048666.1 tripartite tricarboxylate transporter substrate binding protein [Halomonas desiderata]OUE40551.1 hypothetical protein BZY95_13945 [Halomonas desiderata SP1]
MTNFSRRSVLKFAAAGAASTLFAPSMLMAQGNTWPTRPLSMVVPFATGGYNDRLARAFIPFLQEELGQPFSVANRPGAGTMLGNTFFLQQPQDGYTVMCNSVAPYIPLTILLQDAPYSVRDFQMINLPSRDFTLAAAPADSDLESFEEAISRLRENPRSLSLGVQPNSADYLNLVLTMNAAGIDTSQLRLVTYDGGGPARNAAAGGHVDISFVGGEGFLPLLDRIKPLMVFSNNRVDAYPDTMSSGELAEAIGEEVESVEGSQRGWVVSTAFMNEHPDRYEILVDAVERASKNPECIATLEAQQLATTWYGPEQSQADFLANYESLERHIDLLREA